MPLARVRLASTEFTRLWICLLLLERGTGLWPVDVLPMSRPLPWRTTFAAGEWSPDASGFIIDSAPFPPFTLFKPFYRPILFPLVS